MVGAASSAAGAPTPPPAASPTEQQPLLPRAPSAPVVSRCLLLLRARDLQQLLFVLFLVHLARTGQFRPWAESVVVTLSADVFWLFVALLSALSSASLLANFRGFESWLCWGLSLASVLTVLWHALLRICVLHKLALRCLAPALCPRSAEDPAVPELWGVIDGLLLQWAWAPVGVFLALWNTLWRPWYVLLYALPLGVQGHGPLTDVTWWQWREAVVGTVFWGCMSFVALAVRSRAFLTAAEADRRFLLMVGTVGSFLCTLMAFYLTVAPLVRFWRFLFVPWSVLGRSAFHWKPPRLNAEEWLALVAMSWGCGRVLFIAASARIEQWSARQHMEELLNEAMAHPFRAELEQGFGLMDTGGGPLGRALSRMSSAVSVQQQGSLKEKHRALIAARRRLLLETAGCQAALPSHLRLSIQRQRLLEDTWAALFDRPVSELLAPRVSVQFEGEQGVDVGGLSRDWFDSVGRALAEQAPESLLATAPDQTLIPRRVGSDYGSVSLEHQEKFRALLALGRFMALAVFHEHPLPVSFSLILCKYLLRVPVGMGDVRQLDPEFYNGRVAQVLKEDGLAETAAALGEPLTFVSAASEFCPEPEELKPGGAQLVVTEENKTEYVQLLCEAYLCGGIRREIQCLLQGFWDVLPPEVLDQSELTPRELSVLMSGVADMSPTEWREHSDSNCSQVQLWFWELVHEMTREQRCMLLHFATGSSRLPPGGFADLRPRFTVSVSDSGSQQHLPHAHTCANQIVLHRYTSKEQLRVKLLHALLTEDFGFT